ncbi:LolA family protein [Cerasicoccus frondis]|uniref:LolA family protein n=1 Tax=Cerasicoccus frondis TaxID=490090 RepID=UPI0028527A42|nr:hypothetical protein [Cerasicoccus frondis]
MKTLFTILSVGLMMQVALAQTPPTEESLEDQLREEVPAESDPVAEQLFATSVKAMGGAGAIQQDTMSANLKFSEGPNVTDMKIFTKRPGKIRSEIEIEHMGKKHEVITGYNGEEAWTFDTSEKNPFPEKIGGKQADELKELAAEDDLLLTWKERGCVIKYLGPVNNRRQKNYLVKLYYPNGKTEYFYFHPKNYLITRRGNKQVQSGVIVNVDVFFVKYDKVDGYWLPVKTEIAYEDEVVMKLELSDIQLNQPLSDSLFNPPEVKEVWLKGKNAQ